MITSLKKFSAIEVGATSDILTRITSILQLFQDENLTNRVRHEDSLLETASQNCT